MSSTMSDVVAIFPTIREARQVYL